jgi:hypothetical protein
MAHVDLTNHGSDPRTHPTDVYQLFIHSLEFNHNGQNPSGSQSPVTTTTATIDFTRPQESEVVASLEVNPVLTHPFYSEGVSDKESDEVREVVFNLPPSPLTTSPLPLPPHQLEGVLDDENHTHTADYIQV